MMQLVDLVVFAVTICRVFGAHFEEFHLPIGNLTVYDFQHVDLYDNYIRLGGKTSLNVRVKSRGAARILLQRDRDDYSNNTVGILLRDENLNAIFNNTFDGAPVVEHMDNDTRIGFRDFWVMWVFGCIKVGKGHNPNTNEILSWCGLTYLPNYIAIGAGYESDVWYQFEQPDICDKNPCPSGARCVYGKNTFSCRFGSDVIECYPNQTIHLANPNSAIYTHYTGFYEQSGIRTNCTGYADSNKDNLYFDCASTTATVTIYISGRSLSKDMILGGKARAFTFQCLPPFDYNTTITKDMDVGINTTDESSTPIYNITAGFYSSPGVEVTSAQVGDVVFFVINGPAEYDLVPLQCNATGTAGEYRTVTTDGCTEDPSLMSSFMIQKKYNLKDYVSRLHVFKFYTSDSVTITCNVQVCVTSSCPFKCGGKGNGKGNGRRMRAISDMDNLGQDDVKMATIGKRLNILNVELGASSKATGSTILTILVSILVGVLRI